MISPHEFKRLACVALASLLPSSTAEQTDDYRWSAASPRVVVVVDYEEALAELSVWLRQPDQQDHPFEVSDILRATDCPEASWQRLTSIHTTDPTVAAELLDLVASYVQTFAGAFLRGDERAFAEARALRSERAAAYTRGINLAPTVRAANEAWAAGDLQRVVETLDPVRDHLSEREARRLSFAESRLERGTTDQGEA